MKLSYYIIIFLLILSSCKSIKSIDSPPTSLSTNIEDTIDNFPPPSPLERELSSEDSEGVGNGVIVIEGMSTSSRGMGGPKTKSITISETQPKSTVKQNVPSGTVFYNIPDTMDIQQTYTVTVRISKAKNITSMITDFKDTVKTAVIKTSSKMEVRLIDVSNSFTIVADNSGIQVIEDSTTYTQWTWNVTPNKSGVNALKIVVAVFDDSDNKKEIVYQDNILIKGSVEKATLGFFEEYWQWIISTIIIPLVVWLYKRKKGASNES